MSKLITIWFESLKQNGIGSEKRCTKFAVVAVLLILTIIDSLYEGLRAEIVLLWMTYTGYDGYRNTQEKKLNLKNDSNDSVDQKIP